MQAAALELAEHGITVNAIAPGEIATKVTGQQDQDPTAKERAGIPLDRPEQLTAAGTSRGPQRP